MLLYSRKKVRYRRDGYCWKKRKDGKTTREDHMKLKVQGMEVSQPVTSSNKRNLRARHANLHGVSSPYRERYILQIKLRVRVREL